MRELLNAKVTHVSYVDKAANKKKFFLTKSEQHPDFEKEVKLVTKADDPQQLVYGIVYEPDVEDAHGDYMKSETIEKAAHEFMENYQHIDKQHDFETEAGKVVESYIAPTDIQIDAETIKKGTWVLVTKASTEMWEAIQKGEFTGYSLAGTAETEEVQKRTQQFFDKSKVYRDIRAAIDAFDRAIWSIFDDYEATDTEKLENVQNEITELSSLIANLQTNKSEKNGLIKAVKSFFNTKKQEEIDMTEEQFAEVLAKQLQPMNERLEKLEKGVAPSSSEPAAPKELNMDAEMLAKAIGDAVAPLNEKLEKLEKARQSNVVEQTYTEENLEKSEVPAYVNAAFPISE